MKFHIYPLEELENTLGTRILDRWGLDEDQAAII